MGTEEHALLDRVAAGAGAVSGLLAAAISSNVNLPDSILISIFFSLPDSIFYKMFPYPCTQEHGHRLCFC